MTYRYDERRASPEKQGLERVADLYVIQDVDVLRSVAVSGDLRRAALRVSPRTRELLNRIIDSGLLGAVRK